MGNFGDYWGENWPALLPAVIFLLVNPWSIWALLRTASARRQRLDLAREQLVDQIEAALISGTSISRRWMYRLSDALAERRQVKLEDLHQPVVTLRRVSRRLQLNPALTDTQREAVQDVVDKLVTEVKSTEGVAALVSLHQVLEAARRDYRARQEALRLIGQVRSLGTYEDTAALQGLAVAASRLRYPDVTERARWLTAYLAQAWSGAPGQPNRAPNEP